MKETIQFTYRDADPFLRVTIDYNFCIGDTVYYETTEAERIKHNIKDIALEGIISKKWIDITDMEITWDVEVDTTELIN